MLRTVTANLFFISSFMLALNANAEERLVVAVFNVEVKGVKIDVGTLDRLTDYLGSLIASHGFKVVPRSQLKERLVETKKGSYQQCYDQSCQIEIGKEMAAQKSLSTQVLSLGGKCKVTLTLYDLKGSTSEKGVTLSGGCGEAQIVESLEGAVEQLVSGSNVSAPAPTAQPPSPAEKLGLTWIRSVPTGIDFTKSEVTVAQYRTCVEAGKCSPAHFDDETCVVYSAKTLIQGKLPASFRGDDQPVVCVDWNQATAFCDWVRGRLPTEEEWFAEASDNGKRKYPWGDTEVTCDTAVWQFGCGKETTWPVCTKARGNSVSGLCDMSGNVEEWTSTSSQSTQLQRGGSWNFNNPIFLQASNRLGSGKTSNSASFGFRCVRPAKP